MFSSTIPIMKLELSKMIQGISSNNPIPSIGYALNASASGSGKVSIPVEPSSLVYSFFKHVSGVPVSEGSKGVAISKLNILDILIEQVQQIKKTGNAAIHIQMPEDRLDSLVEVYKNQFRQAAEAHSKMPYTPAPMVQTGAIFNLLI